MLVTRDQSKTSDRRIQVKHIHQQQSMKNIAIRTNTNHAPKKQRENKSAYLNQWTWTTYQCGGHEKTQIRSIGLLQIVAHDLRAQPIIVIV